MESQPQNPEFRIDPENFPPCINYFSLISLQNKLPVIAENCPACFEAPKVIRPELFFLVDLRTLLL